MIDPLDPDDGPNQFQNAPYLEAQIQGGQLTVSYAVDSSTSNAAYDLTVEFFKADADAFDPRQGEVFLLDDTYTGNDFLNFFTDPTFPGGYKHLNLGDPSQLGLEEGDLITATATDAEGNTSEFSLAVPVYDVGPHQLTVSKVGVFGGDGTVTSTPSGIDCGADCEEIWDFGTTVTLTVVPDPGSTFLGWSGDCAGEAAELIVDMFVDLACEAAFLGQDSGLLSDGFESGDLTAWSSSTQ